MMLLNEEWKEQAVCATVGAEMFFPPDEDSQGGVVPSLYRQAKRICNTCPVRAECLEYILAREGTVQVAQRHGVWGGLTPSERARVSSAR